ncbi:MAG: hypothetical protein J5863_04320, partial [Desulfovibrio sp.]|nr:hypothetical protein [Desulfovibrio sp.]
MQRDQSPLGPAEDLPSSIPGKDAGKDAERLSSGMQESGVLPAESQPPLADARRGWTFPKPEGGPGRLFMVATPIGNALDFSPRARM